MLEIQQTDTAVTFSIKVVPNSSRDQIAGQLGDAIKIKVIAPPESGKANKAVINTLARALSISNKDISIISGKTQPHKRIQIMSITAEQIRQLIT